jgi:8-oxo-dGTP pyrophosphatase MutT (NUDIX family)
VVVVHVLVLRGSELFLLRRANTGFMDGYYALPGGHQEAGESVSAAAIRECREEIGITPRDLQPVCVMPYRSGRHQGLNFLFETSDYDGEPVINEPELFDAGCWVNAAQLPQPVAVWLPDALALRERKEWYREFEWD